MLKPFADHLIEAHPSPFWETVPLPAAVPYLNVGVSTCPHMNTGLIYADCIRPGGAGFKWRIATCCAMYARGRYRERRCA